MTVNVPRGVAVGVLCILGVSAAGNPLIALFALSVLSYLALPFATRLLTETRDRD